MPRGYLLRILLSTLIVAACAYVTVTMFRLTGLPFNLTVVDARTAVVSPIRGIPLPVGMEAGDRVDLPALDPDARFAAIGAASGVAANILPPGQHVDLVLRRGGQEFTVPVHATKVSDTADAAWIDWLTVCFVVLLAAVGLLLVWRGRDWAAAGLAIWLVANLLSFTFTVVPAAGMAGWGLDALVGAFILLGRLGFYIMAEGMAGASPAPPARLAFRTVLALLLLMGMIVKPGAGLIYVATGWAGLMQPGYGLLLAASYLPTVALLTVAYRAAEGARRLRLRWMLWASVAWLIDIMLNDTGVIGFPMSAIVSFLIENAVFLSMLYAVLRHRVVDVSVVLDRTLVYGSVTALVVGALAAVNSLVQHAALGSGASLLLQVAVPLSLGIVLDKLRAFMDKVVERVFFRGKFLQEQALKRFAKRCGHIEGLQHLLDAAVIELRKHTRSPGVALYEISERGYNCARQAGTLTYPALLDSDDPAVVAMRADRKALELAELGSALGEDSCIFPITVLGRLSGLLVCANRPGERYAGDEKKLLSQVARDLGAAWRIIRARDNEALVWAMSRGAVDPNAAFARAKSLTAAWSGPPIAA